MEPAHRGKLAATENINAASPGTMYGINMAFSRSVLDHVPGFDPELGPGTPLAHHEDSLFSHQLIEAGFRMASALEIAVEHHVDASRLSRESFLQHARTQGRSAAYIAHHWAHREIANPRYLLSWYKVHLNQQRLKRLAEWFSWLKSGEGCPIWELSLVESIAFYAQYLIERKRPRNYARRGLTKRAAIQQHTARES